MDIIDIGPDLRAFWFIIHGPGLYELQLIAGTDTNEKINCDLHLQLSTV